MKIGKIYKFYGQFECGDVLVGKFECVDEPTGFLKFSNIVLQKYCRLNNRVEALTEIARVMNSGDSTNCMSRFEDQAIAAYDKFSKSGILPKELVLHNESTYNADRASQITEMKDYFNEI